MVCETEIEILHLKSDEVFFFFSGFFVEKKEGIKETVKKTMPFPWKFNNLEAVKSVLFSFFSVHQKHFLHHQVIFPFAKITYKFRNCMCVCMYKIVKLSVGSHFSSDFVKFKWFITKRFQLLPWKPYIKLRLSILYCLTCTHSTFLFLYQSLPHSRTVALTLCSRTFRTAHSLKSDGKAVIKCISSFQSCWICDTDREKVEGRCTCVHHRHQKDFPKIAH